MALILAELSKQTKPNIMDASKNKAYQNNCSNSTLDLIFRPNIYLAA
jgi:hypothetical protein